MDNWIGSAYVATENQLKEYKRAAAKGFISDKGKALGCSSLNRALTLTDNGIVDPKESFFLESLGGSHKAMEHIKDYLRDILKTLGHDKSLGSAIAIVPTKNSFHNDLATTTKLPKKYKEIKKFE